MFTLMCKNSQPIAVVAIMMDLMYLSDHKQVTKGLQQHRELTHKSSILFPTNLHLSHKCSKWNLSSSDVLKRVSNYSIYMVICMTVYCIYLWCSKHCL